MVVKNTLQCGWRTGAIYDVVTAGEPVDAFQECLDAVVERFRSEPVTPQRFLDLENALNATADEACRQVVEREANRLEADDRTAVPSKVRQRVDSVVKRPAPKSEE